MKAVKLKSGKWRARYVDHYEYDQNGKRKVVLGTVTRDTERKAIKAAMELEFHADSESGRFSVATAVERYVELKKPVISPSTHHSYCSLKRNAYKSIASLHLSELTTERLQSWVSEYSVRHKPKSVRNAFALLVGVIKMYTPSIHSYMSVKLPEENPTDPYTPTDDDIRKLLSSISGTDLERAVILAALGTLRRSEVCSVRYEDISGNFVKVSRGTVCQDGGGTVEKSPKTPQSFRVVSFPASAIEILMKGRGPGDRIVNMTPTAISNAFPRALEDVGLPHFRFHDLRAYAASVRHAIGIPDQYIMQTGGWKSDATLKKIYRRTMADKKKEFDDLANAHLASVIG